MLSSTDSIPGTSPCSSDARCATGMEQGGFSLLAGMSLLGLRNHMHKRAVLLVDALM